jgi:hypothetical protein
MQPMFSITDLHDYIDNLTDPRLRQALYMLLQARLDHFDDSLSEEFQVADDLYAALWRRAEEVWRWQQPASTTATYPP